MIFAGFLTAQNATTSGAFTAEPPTLVSPGFDWRISGDDNRNGKVEVQCRKAGESQWRQALPLMRLQREHVGMPDRSDPQRVYTPEGLDCLEHRASSGNGMHRPYRQI